MTTKVGTEGLEAAVENDKDGGDTLDGGGGAGAKRGVGEIRGARAIGLIVVFLGRFEAFLFNQTGRVVLRAL